jgi:hypothetical protein
MAGILDSFKRLFKRRQHQRYAVEKGTFVIISPSDSKDQEQKVQLIDISEGGMAFIYHGPPSDLETSGILKLLTQKRTIGFDAVTDIPVPGSTRASEPLRRRGVKFKWLGPFERVELSNLIKKVGTFEK